MNSRAGSLAFFLSILAFYLITLQPSLAWGDGIRLQREAITGESFILTEMTDVSFAPDPYPFARLGVAAWDHPLYVMLGHSLVRLFGGRLDPLWLVNFLSALFGAGAVTLLFRWCYGHLVSESGADRVPAVLGALFGAGALAVSHTFWWHASTPEVYTLFAFLLLLTINLYEGYRQSRRVGYLIGAAFTLGLGMANHLLALLAVPALCLVEIRRGGAAPQRSGRHRSAAIWLLALVAFLLGLAPYLIQLLRLLRTFSLAEVLGPAAGVTFLRGSLALRPGALLASAGQYLILLLYQFGPAGMALGLFGWWAGRHRYPRLWELALPLYLSYLLFGLVYRVTDQFAFFLGAHLFWAVAMVMGTTLLLRRLAAARRRMATGGLALLLVAMPLLYRGAPGWLRSAGVDEAAFGIPQIGTGVRDGLDYYLNPNRRGDRQADRFGRESLASLPAQALVISEWYVDTDEYFIFRYLTVVEGQRADVDVLGWPLADPFTFNSELVVERVEQEVGRRPVYLASLSDEFYNAAQLVRRYCVVPEHRLYRIYPEAPADRAGCMVSSGM